MKLEYKLSSHSFTWKIVSKNIPSVETFSVSQISTFVLINFIRISKFYKTQPFWVCWEGIPGKQRMPSRRENWEEKEMPPSHSWVGDDYSWRAARTRATFAVAREACAVRIPPWTIQFEAHSAWCYWTEKTSISLRLRFSFFYSKNQRLAGSRLWTRHWSKLGTHVCKNKLLRHNLYDYVYELCIGQPIKWFKRVGWQFCLDLNVLKYTVETVEICFELTTMLYLYFSNPSYLEEEKYKDFKSIVLRCTIIQCTRTRRQKWKQNPFYSIYYEYTSIHNPEFRLTTRTVL